MEGPFSIPMRLGPIRLMVWFLNRDLHELSVYTSCTFCYVRIFIIILFLYFNYFRPSLLRCIYICLQEEFLRDVMQFLILRGHSRLIPQGGLAEFPDAILNAKRLDLYNLYREVTCFLVACLFLLVRDDCYVNYVACLFYDFYVQASLLCSVKL